MNKRIVARPTSSATRLPADLHPVLRRVYAARTIETEADLDYSLDRLIPPAQLGGLADAGSVRGTVP